MQQFLAATYLPDTDLPEALFTPDQIDIPFHEFRLPNGLRLVVHEDHKAPIVAVNVWYHVGSKNEREGKSGFAHLFEHLMFNGSEHFNDDYFQALQAIGATELNGTTSHDRTNYFQNVPTAALEQVLWLESDRMGHLLGAIDQAKLDEQRGVVQNEKRQNEDQPYGRQWEIITHEMFPKGHPYSWTVIGSMEDLDDASLKDVHQWFESYYGAANAVLVVAGDVEADAVYQQVLRYFGDIAPGPTIVRPEVNIPQRHTDTRTRYTDRVPEARIVMVWNTPQLGTREDALLSLAASILCQGKTSPLYKKLVFDDQVATGVVAHHWAKEICGNFFIQANVRPGQSAEQVEGAIVDILSAFIADGPSEDALKRAKSRYFAGLIQGLERIGGFGGKSDILASSTVFGAGPDAYKTSLQYIYDATAEDVRLVCAEWLSSGKFTLVCEPMPDLHPVHTDVDRTTMPGLSGVKSSRFPDLQKVTLSNGLDVILAHRPDVPTVVVNALFNAGYATDVAGKAGLTKLTMNLIDAGTQSLGTLEINERLQLLGARLGGGASLDLSFVNMTTLLPTLAPSLALFADVLTAPVFPESEFLRLKAAQLDAIQREKVTPSQMALRIMPTFLYGAGHPYALPMTGSGYDASIMKIDHTDITGHYQRYITPGNGTLVVVGDLELNSLAEALEKTLGEWRPESLDFDGPALVEPGQGNCLYIIDRPESTQSVVMGGYLIPPYGEVSEVALAAMNNVLGGQFISRINLNLREDKHWTYGAGSFIAHARGQRPLIAYAPVQADKTRDAILEIRKEMQQFADDRPITELEFRKDKDNSILKLPGKWETNAAIAGSVGQIVKYGLPDDYFIHYGETVRSLTIDEVRALSRQLIDPDRIQWFVVGDLQTVLPQVRDLPMQKISVIDTEGNVLDQIK